MTLHEPDNNKMVKYSKEHLAYKDAEIITFAAPSFSTLWIITGAEPITLKPYPPFFLSSSIDRGALHANFALKTCTGP